MAKPQRPDEPSMRPIGFIAVRTWGPEKYGNQRFEEFLDSIPAVFSARIRQARPNEWFPAKDAYSLLELVRAHFGKDAFRDLILYLFNQSVSGFMKGLASFMTPATLSKRASSIWQRIHSHGRLEAKVIDKNHIQSTLYDWNVNKISCEIFAIWNRELLKLSGAKNVKIKEINCVHKGDEFCRWDIQFI